MFIIRLIEILVKYILPISNEYFFLAQAEKVVILSKKLIP